MAIPEEISAVHISQAAGVIDAGDDNGFGEATKYAAIVSGRQYAPKELVGIAAEFATGTRLSPGDFSSGTGSTQAVGYLRNLGFPVVRIGLSAWWVNQNQTFREETEGGYMWSPKRNKNGARNQFYENMRAVMPGDRIYSFRNTRIVAIGIATSHAYDAPKPLEFGTKGENWDVSGWRMDVEYHSLPNPIRPKDHIETIRPALPKKYSPLQDSGDGLQSVYLAEVNSKLRAILDDLLSSAGNELPSVGTSTTRSSREDAISSLEDQIEGDLDVPSTEREQICKARRGQGEFRSNVFEIETGCRLTGVTDDQFLIASHIKPWRHSNNRERLDGNNGLLLTPNADRLFDRGFISFNDEGDLLISAVADEGCLTMLGVPQTNTNCGAFNAKQRGFLEYHRNNVWLRVQE